MLEQWRKIDRAPLYEVSDQGRVRRIAGYRSPVTHLLSLRHRKGYLAAHLSVDGRRFNGPVHQLVCEAFHGPRPSPLHVAAHCDGNRYNNSAANLRWATYAQNTADRVRHGTDLPGMSNPNCKLTDADVLTIRQSNVPDAKLAKKFGVSRTHIWRIRSGKNRSSADVTTLTHEAEREAA